MTNQLKVILLGVWGAVAACTSEPVYTGPESNDTTGTRGTMGGHAGGQTSMAPFAGTGGAETQTRAVDTGGSAGAEEVSTRVCTAANSQTTGAGGTGSGPQRCRAPEAPPSRALAVVQPAFRGLHMRYPTVAVPAPDGSYYLGDARGFLTRLSGIDSAAFTMALDLHTQVAGPDVNIEAGLVGVALSPGTAPGFIYVSYTIPTEQPDAVGNLVIERYRMEDAAVVPDSAQRLLSVALPTYHHHAGTLVFGPDGYLYISLGDGGTGANGQDLTTLLGSILRIEPKADGSYTVPATNPFVGRSDARSEIFAYGLRNPWRFSFDRQTGQLWAGDVGFKDQEEVDVIEAGGNYGWRQMEGNLCLAGDCSLFIPPIHAYPHSLGCSVIGGFVYRGAAIPELKGRYLFADYCNRWVQALDPSTREVEIVVDLPATPTAFAETPEGELIVLMQDSPAMLLAPNPDRDAPDTLPRKLSDTGCVNSSDARSISEALVPYSVTVPLWSDGADKRRWLSLPEGASISVDASGALDYPVGTVFVKEFSRNDILLETRLLMRHPSGEWGGYTYRWNSEQTDADLLDTSVTATQADGSSWLFPSRGQCLQCHNSTVGPVLGPQMRQLGGIPDEDDGALVDWDESGLFDGDYRPGLETLGVFSRTDDEAASLDSRARSYLHVNCSTCHSDVQAGHAKLDLRYDTPLGSTGMCATPSDSLGIAAARIVSPNDPAKSVLLARVSSPTRGRMPKLSSVVDPDGVLLLHSWIEQLASCP